MIKVRLQSLFATTSGARAIPLKMPIYGVRISEDSELDRCVISMPGSSTDLSWQGAARVQNWISAPDGDTVTTVQPTDLLLGPKQFHVSVARPFNGRIPAGELVVTLARRAQVAGTNRPAFLGLDLLTHPEEAMWIPTSRAPLCLDAGFKTTNGTNQFLYIPVYGRKSHTLELNAVADSGTHATWQLDGYRSVGRFAIGPAVQDDTEVITSLVASTLLTGDVAWEGGGEYDWLVATFTSATAARNPTVNVFYRGED